MLQRFEHFFIRLKSVRGAARFRVVCCIHRVQVDRVRRRGRAVRRVGLARRVNLAAFASKGVRSATLLLPLGIGIMRFRC